LFLTFFACAKKVTKKAHKLFSFLEKKKVSKKEKIPYMNLSLK